MSDNKGFFELYNKTRENHVKLRDIPIDDLNIWCVDHNGLGSPISVGSCRDFCFVARRGSIIVMHERGACLKVHREYWVRATPGATGLALFHDADIIHMLLRDQDQVATLLNYEE